MSFVIESFVTDAAFMVNDPYEESVKSATEKAQKWLDSFEEDNLGTVKQVVSTQTQILPTGDYVTCIITVVAQIEWAN